MEPEHRAGESGSLNLDAPLLGGRPAGGGEEHAPNPYDGSPSESAESVELRMEAAAVFVNDALAGRTRPAAYKPDSRSLRVYQCHHTELYRATLTLAVVMHMSLVFWEAPTRARPLPSPPPHWVGPNNFQPTPAPVYANTTLVEFFISLLYVADIMIQCRYSGFKAYFSSSWNTFEALATMSFLLDIATTALGLVQVQFSRALRPMFIVTKRRHIRFLVTGVIRAIPALLPMLVLVFVPLAICAFLGVVLFSSSSGLFPDLPNKQLPFPPYCTPYQLAPSPFVPNGTRPQTGCDDFFGTIALSMYAMFAMLNPSTWPSVGIPFMERHWESILFFVAFMTLYHLFLFRVIVAVAFSTFSDIANTRVARQGALTRAYTLRSFRLLADPDTGFVSLAAFRALSSRIRPKLHPEVYDIVFRAVGGDCGLLGPEAFVAACRLLDVNAKRVPGSRRMARAVRHLLSTEPPLEEGEGAVRVPATPSSIPHLPKIQEQAEDDTDDESVHTMPPSVSSNDSFFRPRQLSPARSAKPSPLQHQLFPHDGGLSDLHLPPSSTAFDAEDKAESVLSTGSDRKPFSVTSDSGPRVKRHSWRRNPEVHGDSLPTVAASSPAIFRDSSPLSTAGVALRKETTCCCGLSPPTERERWAVSSQRAGCRGQARQLNDAARRPVRQFLRSSAGEALVVLLAVWSATVEVQENAAFAAANSPQQRQAALSWLQLSDAFAYLFFVEMLAKLWAYGPWSYARRGIDLLDGVVALSSLGAAVTVDLFHSGGCNILAPASDDCSRLFLTLSLVRGLRVLRVLRVIRVFWRPILAIRKVFPLLYRIGVVMIIVMYSLSIVGMELFAGALSPMGPRAQEVAASSYGKAGFWPINYETIGGSLAASFWLTINAKAVFLYEGVMAGTDSWMPLLYFGPIYIVLLLAFLPVVQAFVIRAFQANLAIIQKRDSGLVEAWEHLCASAQARMFSEFPSHYGVPLRWVLSLPDRFGRVGEVIFGSTLCLQFAGPVSLEPMSEAVDALWKAEEHAQTTETTTSPDAAAARSHARRLSERLGIRLRSPSDPTVEVTAATKASRSGGGASKELLIHTLSGYFTPTLSTKGSFGTLHSLEAERRRSRLLALLESPTNQVKGRSGSETESVLHGVASAASSLPSSLFEAPVPIPDSLRAERSVLSFLKSPMLSPGAPDTMLQNLVPAPEDDHSGGGSHPARSQTLGMDCTDAMCSCCCGCCLPVSRVAAPQPRSTRGLCVGVGKRAWGCCCEPVRFRVAQTPRDASRDLNRSVLAAATATLRPVEGLADVQADSMEDLFSGFSHDGRRVSHVFEAVGDASNMVPIGPSLYGAPTPMSLWATPASNSVVGGSPVHPKAPVALARSLLSGRVAGAALAACEARCFVPCFDGLWALLFLLVRASVWDCCCPTRWCAQVRSSLAPGPVMPIPGLGAARWRGLARFVRWQTAHRKQTTDED
jgi:hypothetical protein